MKPVNFTQSFKVTKNSPHAEQIGVKRDTVTYSINTIEAVDVPELPAEQVSVVLNNALELHAKKLFAANGTNWDYIPSEADVTLEAVFTDLTAPSSRGARLLTKESLDAFASLYEEFAVKSLEKSEKGAKSGAAIIRAKLAPILGNEAALVTFNENLTALMDVEEFITAADNVVEMLEALLGITSEALDSKLELEAL